MKSKMRAAVVEEFGKPLVLRDWDVSVPGPGQILVRTEACGVCGTDVHAARGDWPFKPALPFIPGHEAIGRVVALGSGVAVVKEGDRVGVPWLYSACGHCEYCLSAWETICPQAKFGGYTQNGGFAEYVIADPNYVARIPAGLGPENAAPIICAGVTSYKGIKETGAKPGQWIAISGAGGLGHLAIQYAKAMGLLVCAVDIDDGKLAHAKRLGADVTTHASAGRLRTSIPAFHCWAVSVNSIFKAAISSTGPGTMPPLVRRCLGIFSTPGKQWPRSIPKKLRPAQHWQTISRRSLSPWPRWRMR